MASSNTDSILDRIQAMLDRAAHPETNEHEREICLRKADQMMAVHKLDEAALRSRSVAKGFTEEKRHQPTHIKIDWVQEWDEFYPVHQMVVSYLARLTGVRLVHIGGARLHVFGMPDDVDYFRMLWLSTYLTFSSKLFPEWNKELPPHQQIRLLVEAGYKWEYIWDQAVRNGQPFTRIAKGETIAVPRPTADNGWMKRQLKKAYAETGEEKPQLTHGVKNYRNSYAIGFQQALVRRVEDLLDQRRRLEAQAVGGAQLMLRNDVDAVQKLLDSIYPPHTLSSSGRARGLRGDHAGAAARGQSAAASVDMSGGRGGLAPNRRALG